MTEAPAAVPAEPVPVPPPPDAERPVAPPRGRARFLLLAGLPVLALAAFFLLRREAPHAEAEAAGAPAVPYVENDAIVVSPDFRRLLAVETAAVDEAPLTPVVRATGTVSFDPQATAAVSTRIRGNVRRILKVDGDAVKKGEVVAEIESAELGAAQSELTVALAQLGAAEANAEREESLAGRQLTTGRELELARVDLAQARALATAAEQRVRALGGEPDGPFGLYLVRSPLDGTVVERHLHIGQSVDGSEVVYQITNLDRVWVELDVFNPQIDSVRAGDEVEIAPPAHPERTTRGTIAHVGEIIDPATRSARMRVVVDNRERALRPGASVVARIRATGPMRTALVVPSESVTLVDGRPTVFVEREPNRFVATSVRTGGADGRSTAIVEGLSRGERVVVKGVFGLKSELFR